VPLNHLNHLRQNCGAFKTRDITMPFTKLLNQLQYRDPIKSFERSGVPAKEIISIARHYLSCAGIFDERLTDGCVVSHLPLFANLIKVYKSSYADTFVNVCNSIFTKIDGRVEIQEALAAIGPDIAITQNRFWTTYNHWDEDFDPSYDTVVKWLRMAADLLEHQMLPYMRFLHGSLSGKVEDPNELGYGKLVGFLCDRNDTEALGNIWGIRLNQWRNIFNHGHYKIRKNHIECKFGSHNQFSFCLKLSDIRSLMLDFAIVRTLLLCIYEVVIRRYNLVFSLSEGEPLRTESLLVGLYQRFSLIGFSIIDIDDTEKYRVTISVKDRREGMVLSRALHPTQHLFEFKELFDRQILKMKVFSIDGSPFLEAEISGKTAELMIAREIGYQNLSKRTTLRLLRP
jgi:hypothetical protein